VLEKEETLYLDYYADYENLSPSDDRKEKPEAYDDTLKS